MRPVTPNEAKEMWDVLGVKQKCVLKLIENEAIVTSSSLGNETYVIRTERIPINKSILLVACGGVGYCIIDGKAEKIADNPSDIVKIIIYSQSARYCDTANLVFRKILHKIREKLLLSWERLPLDICPNMSNEHACMLWYGCRSGHVITISFDDTMYFMRITENFWFKVKRITRDKAGKIVEISPLARIDTEKFYDHVRRYSRKAVGPSWRIPGAARKFCDIIIG